MFALTHSTRKHKGNEINLAPTYTMSLTVMELGCCKTGITDASVLKLKSNLVGALQGNKMF